MITAQKLRQICCINPNEVLLYGYTMDRKTLFLFIDNENNLVRVEENRHGETLRYETSKFVHPSIWTRNVKRWYRDATNESIRELCASFLEYGLSETDGGEKWFAEEYYCNPPNDERFIDLDEAPAK